jgi:hypothetical protein
MVVKIYSHTQKIYFRYKKISGTNIFGEMNIFYEMNIFINEKILFILVWIFIITEKVIILQTNAFRCQIWWNLVKNVYLVEIFQKMLLKSKTRCQKNFYINVYFFCSNFVGCQNLFPYAKNLF